MSQHPVTIKVFVEPSFGENSLVVSTTTEVGAQIGWVIDPSFSPHVNRLLEYVRSAGIRIEKIVLTHGHGDHIAGIDAVHGMHPGAEVLIAAEDAPMLTDADRNLSAPFGTPITVTTRAAGDLVPDTELTLGPTRWRILDTSGHSPGGRSLYCQECGIVIVGDAVFAGSIGRTDFPGSDHHRLVTNIRRNLLTLPGETVVYSGHGPTTTIDNERKSNPFLSE